MQVKILPLINKLSSPSYFLTEYLFSVKFYTTLAHEKGLVLIWHLQHLPHYIRCQFKFIIF